MKPVALLLCWVAAAPGVSAGDGVGIPWDEIKTLYRESVQRELAAQAAPIPKPAQVYSIDEARYTLTVGEDGARGEVSLSGKVVSGGPEPIPLFGTEAVFTELETPNGAVLCAQDGGRVALLPGASIGAFELTGRFLLDAREDNGLWKLAFEIPPALRNSLQVTLPKDARLVDPPGIADTEGVFHFAPASRLSIAYREAQDAAAAAAAPTVIEFDAITRIGVQESRLAIAATFVPVRPGPESVMLQAPEGAVFLAASLPSSRVKPLAADRYEIRVTPGETAPFSIEFAVNLNPEDGRAVFALPTIEGNTGKQGRFILEQPDDGQATVEAAGLAAQIPVQRLGDALRASVGDNATYMSAPSNEKLAVSVKRFETVSAPPMVLECQSFFASFEENGNVLCVLVMDVPPEFGSRLPLKAVPDAEIWSLAVNAAKKKIYSGDPGSWIVPLDGKGPSHVELAFLRRGDKLGLQGKLEASIPETGIPSQRLCVGLALPARVDLIAVEGPVNPAPNETPKPPAQIVGKPYYFSRYFYKGEAMNLSISYKEPVKQPAKPGN